MESGAVGRGWALQVGLNQGPLGPHSQNTLDFIICVYKSVLPTILELHGGKNWAWLISPPSITSTSQVTQLMTVRVP